jgi:hypothetical protein
MPRKPIGTEVAKAAFWFPDDVLDVLNALKAQTGMSKSQIMRDLVMSLGAGNPIEHLPETTALPLATAYWKLRLVESRGK